MFNADDDFAKDLDKYLQDLEISPVRSLMELIEYNKKNADAELPPGQYKVHKAPIPCSLQQRPQTKIT
jgi:amidase